jgi:hypothetical protein
MGPVFDVPAFYDWIKSGGRAVFDQVGAGEIKPAGNIAVKDYVSGYTEEAKVRQVEKVEENIVEFLNSQ